MVVRNDRSMPARNRLVPVVGIMIVQQCRAGDYQQIYDCCSNLQFAAMHPHKRTHSSLIYIDNMLLGQEYRVKFVIC